MGKCSSHAPSSKPRMMDRLQIGGVNLLFNVSYFCVEIPRGFEANIWKSDELRIGGILGVAYEIQNKHNN